MKLFSWVLVAVLATVVVAWTKEDHEIFDLVSELEKAEGKGTSFYSFVDVPSSATTQEISKAYRKKSMTMHPDKNPNSPGIHERFSRLGVITKILRTAEERERYDFFYKNGVPKWRGTGYYYSRYRPGVGAVLVFLVIVTSAVQYLILKLTRTTNLKRLEDMANQAKASAWGPKMVPVAGKRRMKMQMGASEGSAPITTIDVVVEGTEAYILDPSGEKFYLDERGVPEAAVLNTWFIALIKSQYKKWTGKATSSDVVNNNTVTQLMSGGGDESDATASGTESTKTKATTVEKKKSLIKPTAPGETSMAGGARRKQPVRTKSSV